MERLRSQLALAAFLQEVGEAVEQAELVCVPTTAPAYTLGGHESLLHDLVLRDPLLHDLLLHVPLLHDLLLRELFHHTTVYSHGVHS